MTEYFIKLQSGNAVHKPNFAEWYNNYNDINENVRIALSAFDTDGVKGLSSDELKNAYDYFVNKEKEVAVIGKKGDGLITTKDIEQIVKTDTKFSAIREHLNDDNEATTLLQNIVMTLINIVTLNNSEKITKITEHGFMVKSDNVKGERFVHSTLNSSATQVELEEKTINGANVKVYKSTEGEEYVTTQDNRKYNEEYAAKYLGYKIEKTWFGFGEDKYYTTETQSNGKQYCQYKIWDEDTHSFKNGKRIFIGHFRSTGTL